MLKLHFKGMDGNDADAAMTSLLSDATAKLGSTVTSLPQVTLVFCIFFKRLF